jgi:hypothetical protein
MILILLGALRGVTHCPVNTSTETDRRKDVNSSILSEQWQCGSNGFHSRLEPRKQAIENSDGFDLLLREQDPYTEIDGLPVIDGW